MTDQTDNTIKTVIKHGVTHQQAQTSEQTLTTAQGAPIADAQNSLKAGERGPTLLEDHQLREKIFHFDHERIPERVVHARGYGAHGYFENYDDLSDITAAGLFKNPGQKTEVFVRFSTVLGNKGSPDVARDVRGFAVKFYTDEGNWDIVGNNIPVFFIQDTIKFPDLIHSGKPAPDRAFPQAQTAHDNFWDFISLTPESMHMIMWSMSDRTLPRSFRTMEGFGVHTFRFINNEGQSTYVKFHWKPVSGLQSVMWDEAQKLNGKDPDFHRRDLHDAIEAGNYPEWELGVQLFDDEFAEQFEFDILDSTKIIPEEQIPVRPIGKMVLNRNVDNFFSETEQVAFCTQNLVKGIGNSDDPLLLGRHFSYLDTQLKRLGSPNFTHIPVNAPRCPFSNFYQGGHMRTESRAGRVNYEPNSWPVDEAGPRENPQTGFESYPEEVQGQKRRVRSETFADHYSQAIQFYKSQTPVEQEHMAEALSFELSKVQREDIRARVVSHLLNIDQKLATAVADNLRLNGLPEPATPAREPVKDLPASDALSIEKNLARNFTGRKLGIVVTDKAPASMVDALKTQFHAINAMVEFVTPFIGGVELDDGSLLVGDQSIEGGPSVLYDAVAVVGDKKELSILARRKAFMDFVSDATFHCKYMGLNDAAVPFVKGLLAREDLLPGQLLLKADDIQSFIEQCHRMRCWERMEVLA